MAGEVIAYPPRFAEQVDFGEGNKRDWVFQERMLETHVLHFTRDQIFWECRSLHASETLPLGDQDLEPAYMESVKN